jgi:hypothetical protein
VAHPISESCPVTKATRGRLGQRLGSILSKLYPQRPRNHQASSPRRLSRIFTDKSLCRDTFLTHSESHQLRSRSPPESDTIKMDFKLLLFLLVQQAVVSTATEDNRGEGLNAAIVAMEKRYTTCTGDSSEYTIPYSRSWSHNPLVLNQRNKRDDL